MKKKRKKRWTGKPKEKGQVFAARIIVQKITANSIGIPTVITINKTDYILRPSNKRWTGKPKEKGQIFSAKVKVQKIMTGSSGIPTVIMINNTEYILRP